MYKMLISSQAQGKTMQVLKICIGNLDVVWHFSRMEWSIPTNPSSFQKKDTILCIRSCPSALQIAHVSMISLYHRALCAPIPIIQSQKPFSVEFHFVQRAVKYTNLSIWVAFFIWREAMSWRWMWSPSLQLTPLLITKPTLVLSWYNGGYGITADLHCHWALSLKFINL